MALAQVDMPAAKLGSMVGWLERTGVGRDLDAYRDAPGGLRVWCGPTVEARDVGLLMDWIAYAHDKFSN